MNDIFTKTISAARLLDDEIITPPVPAALVEREAYDGADAVEQYQKAAKCYAIYRNGCPVFAETRGSDPGSDLRYKKTAEIIDKVARFAFAEPPDINVKSNDADSETLSAVENAVNIILSENDFAANLMLAAKDAMIAGSAAVMANFPAGKCEISFFDATRFTAEYYGNVLVKFAGFTVLREHTDPKMRVILLKRWELENGVIYVTDEYYDGGGDVISDETFSGSPKTATELTAIPAAVVLNDALSFERHGSSDIVKLVGYEEQYSRLANSDADTVRYDMNPERYTMDVDFVTTKNMVHGKNAYQDLQTSPTFSGGQGKYATLSIDTASYAGQLETAMKRTRADMFEEMDVPDITLENIQGIITSGKALKSLYWGMLVRCKEKFLPWQAAIKKVILSVIEQLKLSPEMRENYGVDMSLEGLKFDVDIIQNYPLPEDEADEKAVDLQEVAAGVMSKLSYNKKWRGLTNDEALAEINQINDEKAAEESAVNGGGGFADDGEEE